MANKSTYEVERTTINLLDSIKEKMQTVISDDGKEIAKHESIAKNLDASFYLHIPMPHGKEGLMKTSIGSSDSINWNKLI